MASNANADDARATRSFAVLNVLVNHCGEKLTADLVDQLAIELLDEIEKGPTAWAFREMPSGRAGDHHRYEPH